MAQVIVAQRMWQRRDTAANWTSKNPILAGGEIGVQLGASAADTKFKIGDGVTAWNSLGYAAATPTQLSALGSAANTYADQYRQIRVRDTEAALQSLNPTLLVGEWGYETNTGKVKIGDGYTPWNSLKYFLDGKPTMFVQNSQPAMVSGDLWLDISAQV